MSTSGISSTSFYNPQSIQDNFQQIQQEFQQLGQDLESGNLSAAQQDFVTRQSLTPQGSSTTSTESNNNPIAQAFNQLAQDLQSGNLSAAQQDYAQIQQDFQSQTRSSEGHHHHHGGNGNGQSQISQLFSQLGQELQSGNLSAAQQVFATLQQDFQQFGQNGSEAAARQTTSANALSVTA